MLGGGLPASAGTVGGGAVPAGPAPVVEAAGPVTPSGSTAATVASPTPVPPSDQPPPTGSPTTESPTTEPGDVTVDEVAVAVAGAGQTALPADAASDADIATRDDAAQRRIVSEVVDVEEYHALGVTWAPDGPAGLEVSVRTETDGQWGEWVELETDDAAPDAGTSEAAAAQTRAGTGSVWIGGATRAQLAFDTEARQAQDLRVALVTSPPEPVSTPSTASRASSTSGASLGSGASGARVLGTSVPASGAVTTAAVAAAATAPGIISRAGWGAAPQRCEFDVAPTLLAAVVHHTAGPNSYRDVSEAAAQIRADQAYHQNSRGWCDIGYNYLVDKWGNVYEGRAGSGDRPVIGVHAGGFNTSTVGISMLGDYSSSTPPAATQESVARLIAWRMAAYHRDPTSTVGYTTLGGENSRYGAGTTLALPVVVSHRDLAYTACPGQAGYATLGAIRQRSRDLLGAGLVNPALSRSTVPYGSGLSVVGGVVSTVDWTLTVNDERSGATVARRIGSTGPSGGGAIITWDGRSDAGQYLGAGRYRLTVTGTQGGTGATVVPWSSTFTVEGSQDPAPVPEVPLGSRLGFVPVAPARLVDTRLTGASLGPHSRMDLTVAGVAGVPADARAVAINVTAVHSQTVTHLRVWPAGSAMPDTSTLNTDERRTSASGTFVGVGGDGKVSIYNHSGSTHVIVDITGYFTDGASGAGYVPLDAGVRLLDSRSDGGRLTSAATRRVQVAGREGIPSDASAVVMNLTSVGPSGVGNVVAYPSGGARPTVSSVNHYVGDNVSNRQVIPLGADGAVDLALQGAAADVVVDVVGWFGPGGTTYYTPQVPARAVDSRGEGGPLGAGAVRTVDLRRAGVPDGARAVAAVLTATQQTEMTFLTAWRPGLPRPLASDLNTGNGRDQANLVVPAVSADESIQVYNDRGTTQVIVDVQGWFEPRPPR
ncbi:N-acetylmuramoyl-L-alanine amidase [Cellulomonas wangleii]|uniref:N-acetylmuramoyl-L-alanine amidase n=1 Tax=Cellulomonas wangleii TaxID=2816956 RepID=A0ABX8D178_9CELL|nr:N-acetylmuramoyl-L-alanine amidase [Cellulomonas wangleii]QVI61215.1 N-acetylmuramoyl-L-alanine amidase [Cellulomonas wangleii]